MKTHVKTKFRIFIAVVLLTGWVCLSFEYPDQINTNSLQNTRVIAHLNEKIEPYQNTVYASTFLMAWKMLREQIIREDVLLEKPLSMIPQLNNASSAIQVDEGFLALAGLAEEGIVQYINEELQGKFNTEIPGLLAYDGLKDNIICFSYFDHEIHFKYPFEEHKQLYPFFAKHQRTDVACFGLGGNYSSENAGKVREQVAVYDNQGCNNFILQLHGDSNENELYLAKTPIGKTLGETIRNVEKRISNSRPEPLNDEDILVIPKLNLSVNKTYKELLGKHLANKGFEEYFFAVAQQGIDFSMDESGAKTKSDAVVVLKKGPCKGLYLFDRPFLLYLKKQGASMPYLAMWIADPGIMLRGEE